MCLLTIGKCCSVDGRVWADWSDHQRPQHLALIVEEVLAVGGGHFVRGGGSDGGGGGGRGEVGVVAWRTILPWLQTRHRGAAATQGALGEAAEDDESGRDSDGTNHNGDDGSDDNGDS